MVPLQYISEILIDFRFLYIYIVVSFIISLINKIILKHVINGLIVLNFTSSIVISIVIDLYFKSYISLYKLFFFSISEILIFILVIFIYKSLVKKSNKEQLKLALLKFNDKYFNLLVLFVLISILINIINVSHDGTSRIAFNVNRWYSFVRIMNTLTRPALAFVLFYNIELKNKKKYIYLFSLIVAESITSGSRSGFVFFLIGYFLIYKDIFKSRILSSRSSIIASVLFLAIISSLTLKYNNLGVVRTFERLIHYGESTIMVYPLADPPMIVKGQSEISIIHRGFGRLFGDPSSTNIDKLFGYALSAEFYGENTLTGPNARIGSYALCAFPGSQLILLYFVFFIYLKFSYYLLKTSIKSNPLFYMISLLLIIDSIQQFIFDYNTGMSNFTIILILIISQLINKSFFSIKYPLQLSNKQC